MTFLKWLPTTKHFCSTCFPLLTSIVREARGSVIQTLGSTQPNYLVVKAHVILSIVSPGCHSRHCILLVTHTSRHRRCSAPTGPHTLLQHRREPSVVHAARLGGQVGSETVFWLIGRNRGRVGRYRVQIDAQLHWSTISFWDCEHPATALRLRSTRSCLEVANAASILRPVN